MNRNRYGRPARGARVGVALFGAALLAACGGGGGGGATNGGSASGGEAEDVLAVQFSPDEQQELIALHDDWAEGGGEKWEELLAAAQEEGTVAVASTPNPAVRDLISKQFEADTGITVQYLPNAVPAEITGRLRQEAAAGQMSLDVFLSGYPGVVDDLPAGLLRPLEPELVLPSVTDVEGWDGGALPWQDNSEEYMLRLLNYVTGYPTVNADVVDPDTIKVWDDLLEADLSGQIAQFDPRRPGPGSPAAVFIAVDKGRDFAEKFYGQQEITFTTDQRQLADWVARGTYPVGLGVDVKQAQELRAEGFPLEAVFPEDAPGLLTSGYGILRLFAESPNPNAAIVFANWLASPRGAQVLQLSFDQPSSRADVEVTDNIPREIIPQDGVDYVDQNTEDYVKEGMVPGTALLGEIIGN